jgi:hypothetical protein
MIYGPANDPHERGYLSRVQPAHRLRPADRRQERAFTWLP